MNSHETMPVPENDSYYRSKSLDIFHEAQQAALNTELRTATDKLQEALAIAEEESDPEWSAYIRGTLNYLNGDLNNLKKQVALAGENSKILSRLAAGLGQRGIVDYRGDYSL